MSLVASQNPTKPTLKYPHTTYTSSVFFEILLKGTVLQTQRLKLIESEWSRWQCVSQFF